DAMPDFYAAGHASLLLGEKLPRLSLAAHLCSPTLKAGYAEDTTLIDARNVEGPLLPWSIEVRAAAESQLTPRVGLRFVLVARTLSTVPSPSRVGDSAAPQPKGGLGASTNPVAPLSAMV